MKKILAWILIPALLAGFAVWMYFRIQEHFQDEQKVKQRSADAVAVDAVLPVRTSIEDRRIFTGTLKPWSQIEIASKISGRLESVHFDVGDRIAGSDEIARIEASEYKQKVNQAEADLEIAKAQLRQTEIMLDLRRREYDRQAALNEKKATTQALLESAETAFHAQEASYNMQNAEVKRREALLGTAKLDLAECVISADWRATDNPRFVGKRYVDRGALLSANQPILTIAELDPLRAVIHVIERDYPYLKRDQEAVLSTDAYPGQEFKGRVARISQLMQDNTRQAAVQLEIPNSELKLKPGMFVRVQLEFKSKENAVVVPRNAIVKRNNAQGVFLLDVKEKKARFVPVEIGITEGNRVEILAPELTAPVITLGSHLLTDGTPVALPQSFRTPPPQPGNGPEIPK